MAEYGRLANQAEGEQKYKIAYDYYIKALDTFTHIITCKSSPQDLFFLIDEKNPKLIDIYKRNQRDYLIRAEEIKS